MKTRMFDILRIALEADESSTAELSECLLDDLDHAGYDFENYSTVTMFQMLKQIGHSLDSLDTFNAACKIDTAVVNAK